MSPLLAQSGHPDVLNRCPLLRVKRTLLGRAPMSAYDPKRTFDPVPPRPQDKPNLASIAVRLLRWIKLRLSNVPNAVGETIAGDVARLLVVFPGIERVAL